MVASHLVKTAVWVLVISLFTLGSIAQSRLKPNPSDELSYRYNSGKQIYSASERLTSLRVYEIFKERLRGVHPKSHKLLAEHLVTQTARYRLDPALVLSLIQVESGFNTYALSPKGARGLLQLLPPTALELSRRKRIGYENPASLYDPFINLSLGVAYLAQLRDQFKGLPAYFHLTAYNLGPTRLKKLMKQEKFVPGPSLQYVKKITQGIKQYRHVANL